MDNNNAAVWRLGSNNDPIFIATTDIPFPYKFNIDTLETEELLRPANGITCRAGTAHWLREPNTDNSIYGLFRRGNFIFQNHFEVQRFTPNNTGNFSNYSHCRK